jgi:hypothetical protein
MYRIIRFRQHGRPRTMRQRLTLEEAQAHCRRDDTHGPGWFDGYDTMRGIPDPDDNRAEGGQ